MQKYSYPDHQEKRKISPTFDVKEINAVHGQFLGPIKIVHLGFRRRLSFVSLVKFRHFVQQLSGVFWGEGTRES